MNPTIIDTIYERNMEILKYLDSRKEVTYRSDFEEAFRKNLVLSISSYFEHLIGQIILEFVKEKTRRNELICNFVKQKGVTRQFHTFFEWQGKNANVFFSLFGQEFKQRCESRVKSDPELDAGVRAFLELGETRNLLVHLNFADYQLEKTSQEFYQLYQKSLLFIEFVQDELNGS
jgi:hypothetical protein